jgi:hypothetical protein
MSGLNKYEDKRKREVRRKFHEEKDLRFPKRKTNDIEDEEYDA